MNSGPLMTLLPAALKEQVRELITLKSTAAESFVIRVSPELKTYIVAYGDMPSLQLAVVRALMGQIEVVGKLPISLPGLYPRGTGIQLKRS